MLARCRCRGRIKVRARTGHQHSALRAQPRQRAGALRLRLIRRAGEPEQALKAGRARALRPTQPHQADQLCGCLSARLRLGFAAGVWSPVIGLFRHAIAQSELARPRQARRQARKEARRGSRMHKAGTETLTRVRRAFRLCLAALCRTLRWSSAARSARRAPALLVYWRRAEGPKP